METNPNTNKKKLWLLIGGVVVIIILIALIIKAANQKKTVAPVAENVPVAQPVVNAPTPLAPNNSGPTDKFRTEVPANTQVPGMDAKLTEAQKKDIAVPSIVTPAAPGASTSFRSFSISGEGGKFIPSQIIVHQNDIVHVNFTAMDKDYDIVFPSYGMHQTAKKGEKKVLEFQAVSEGSFTYYCDSCGGPTSPASGKIIVVK